MHNPYDPAWQEVRLETSRELCDTSRETRERTGLLIARTRELLATARARIAKARETREAIRNRFAHP
jgi:hypothetical protein